MPTPVPLKLAVAVPPLTFALNVTVPLNGPATNGVNSTSITQLPFTGIGAAVQLSVSEKSPCRLTCVIFNAALPELVTVMPCAGLVLPTFRGVKLSDVGENVMAGAGGAAPKPLKPAVTLPPEIFPVMVNVPVNVPVVVGEKIMLTVQLPPPAIGATVQLSVSENSPLTDTDLICSSVEPLFITLMLCALLLVPVVWLVNVSEPGVSVTAVAGSVLASGNCHTPRP